MDPHSFSSSIAYSPGNLDPAIPVLHTPSPSPSVSPAPSFQPTILRTTIILSDATGVIWAFGNLRGLLILGLFLQAFLVVYAPQRKRNSSRKLIWLVWSTYFLADLTASFALGMISNSGGDLIKKPGDFWKEIKEKSEMRFHMSQIMEGIDAVLLAFWVPFLLIQSGGADTIISSGIQDLASGGIMWGFRVGLTVYVFFLSFPWGRPSLALLMPRLLLLVAGIAKYAEFGYAVNRACLKGLRKSMVKLNEVDPGSSSSAYSPIHTGMVQEGKLNSDIAVVQRAKRFFERSRGLLIGLFFSFEERRESRQFFQQTTPEEAYYLIAVELNFMYDSLFTKAFMVHTKMGYFIRTISFSILVIALISFWKEEKQHFAAIDTLITYILLYGAIALDVVSFFQHIFSDWTVAALGTYMQYPSVAFVFGKYLTLKRSSLASSTKRNCLQRWSKSVSTSSFLDMAIEKKSKTHLARSTLTEKIRNMLHSKCTGRVMPFGTSSHPLTEELWNFIFMELKRKCELSDIQNATDIYSARGGWVLRSSRWGSDCGHLLSYVNDYDYAQSILLWHIATEICYINNKSYGASCGHSKILSCYMLYLLIHQTTAMSSVGGIFGEIAFRNTSAEAQLLLTREGLPREMELENACNMILAEHSTENKPVDVKKNKSKSILSAACALSKELMKLEENKWDLLSEIWVEMLTYAASHYEPKYHADFLARGGELVSFVWLLTAHLGIMETLVQVNEC